MNDQYHAVAAYSSVAKKIMRILIPYEKHLKVMVKQEDSLCLYTKQVAGKEEELFASVQILSAGVSFTVYNPEQQYNIFECLPGRMKAVYKGENKFLITRINPGLITEIKDLLLALFGTYSLGKYYLLHGTRILSVQE